MNPSLHRREFLALGAAAVAFPRLVRREPSLSVMDTWFWLEKELDIPAQVALLKKCGYGGMALSWGQKHAERLKALRDEKLDAPGLFVVGDLEGDLRGPFEFLKGTEIPIWLALTSRNPVSDDDAAAAVGRLADSCKGLSLALYPHAGFWMDKLSRALSIAQKLKRPDVGIVFNQYPWMATEAGADPRKALESVLPHLKAVTINGSAKQASILPLNEGPDPALAILRALVDLKYTGPVSLQGHGIRGRLPEKLEASMQAWTDLKKKSREVPAGAVWAHVFISGTVQGVSYRASTQDQARTLGVTGWVRNLQDGRVEAWMQGPKEKVDDLIRWCHRGPPAAKVDKVDVTWEKAGEDFKTFEVRS